MTEETTQVENTETKDAGINISIEQILAAIIHTVGETTVSIENLIANYSTKTVCSKWFR